LLSFNKKKREGIGGSLKKKAISQSKGSRKQPKSSRKKRNQAGARRPTKRRDLVAGEGGHIFRGRGTEDARDFARTWGRCACSVEKI